MARKRKHEDHANHEAWAIPFGDLMCLLLAFFVVMYAISSINEGKFRVLSDSLQAAFRGSPKTLEPVQVGEKTRGSGADIAVSIVQQANIEGQPRQMLEAVSVGQEHGKGLGPSRDNGTGKGRDKVEVVVPPELAKVADEVEKSLALLVNAELVTVRRHSFWIEVEIRADILFPSGVATIAPSAVPALAALSKALAPFPNPIRVEGHTDNVPIKTAAFPSNWELSSARAATVVHLLANGGVAANRLSVIGLGEWHPIHPNDTAEGRNANRRVLLVILSGAADSPDNNAVPLPDIDRSEPAEPQAVPGELAAPVLPAAAAITRSTILPPGVTAASN
ncbi:MAG TPA: flagellar motor protein MotD [Steroidobacteraceae bacterium]|jgi:chemotaxis protein MotB|nr:flagellar motor protein MotD [Steroidobacteraceae bacterium]